MLYEVITCPKKGCLGECPAISDQYGHYGNKYQIAHVYWWGPPRPVEEVMAWCEEAGAKVFEIYETKWSKNPIPIKDGVEWSP